MQDHFNQKKDAENQIRKETGPDQDQGIHLTPPPSSISAVPLQAKQNPILQMQTRSDEQKPSYFQKSFLQRMQDLPESERPSKLQPNTLQKIQRKKEKEEEETKVSQLKSREAEPSLKEEKKEEPKEVSQLKSREAEPTLREEKKEVTQLKATEEHSTPSLTGGSSQKMPEQIQAKMETSFGTDFSNVNIHQGKNAAEMNALAYTQGNDIHFAPGQYDPASQQGQELLGHELTHVVQQRQGKVQPTAQLKGVGVNDDAALEKEADDKGKLAASGKTTGTHTGDNMSGNVVQKKDDIFFNHKVLKNEKLSDIASYYNLSMTAIIDMNGLCEGQEPAEGAMLMLPAPGSADTKDKAKDKPKEQGKDYLALKDKKNQLLEIQVSDFQEFLKFYNKYNSGSYLVTGAPKESISMSELQKLKYLLGPIQNENPQIKKFADELQKWGETQGDKLLEAISGLWQMGFWGKVSIVMGAATLGGGAATVAGSMLYNSIRLTLKGENKPIDDTIIEQAQSLLTNIKLNKKSKDLSGNIVNEENQTDVSFKVTNEKGTTGGEFSLTGKNNKPIDSHNWKDLKDNGYSDKTIWYVVSKNSYYDTITLRNMLHDKQGDISSSSQIIDQTSISKVSDIFTIENYKTKQFFHLKDKNYYDGSQLETMLKTGVISNTDKIADKDAVKTADKNPLIHSEKLYGKEVASSNLTFGAGIGLNSGLKSPDYFIKGGYKFTLHGDKSSSVFATNFSIDDSYSKAKYTSAQGLPVEDWVHRRINQFGLSLSQNFNFNTGPVEHSVGGTAAFTHTEKEETKNGFSPVETFENKFLLNPFWKVTYKDPANGKWELELRPEAGWTNDKFNYKAGGSLNYLQVQNNSVIRIQINANYGLNDKTNKQGFQLTGVNVTYFLLF